MWRKLFPMPRSTRKEGKRAFHSLMMIPCEGEQEKRLDVKERSKKRREKKKKTP